MFLVTQLVSIIVLGLVERGSIPVSHLFYYYFSFILNLSFESNNDMWQPCEQTSLVSKSNSATIMTLCVIVT
jgi:hypothetical protein